jgi:hypothetical protein
MGYRFAFSQLFSRPLMHRIYIRACSFNDCLPVCVSIALVASLVRLMKAPSCDLYESGYSPRRWVAWIHAENEGGLQRIEVLVGSFGIS